MKKIIQEESLKAEKLKAEKLKAENSPVGDDGTGEKKFIIRKIMKNAGAQQIGSLGEAVMSNGRSQAWVEIAYERAGKSAMAMSIMERTDPFVTTGLLVAAGIMDSKNPIRKASLVLDDRKISGPGMTRKDHESMAVESETLVLKAISDNAKKEKINSLATTAITATRIALVAADIEENQIKHRKEKQDQR